MRFSAAIHQIIAREPAPALPVDPRDAAADAVPLQPAPQPVADPPVDLDQRVRLSGEW